MRAVVQRVARAEVEVDGVSVGAMNSGLLVLLGVGHADTETTASELLQKILHLRVFEDADGRMNHSLLETGGMLGIVSQFTLFADTRKGRRPSYNEAAAPEVAAPLIDFFAGKARELGVRVITGAFGAEMEVSLTNSGPVTLWIDTEKRH